LKNKTKTYVLLVAVLAIWGIIGFKILSTLNPDAPKMVAQDDTELISPKAILNTEIFTIQSAERDPFLGTLYAKKKINTYPKTIIPKEVFVWIPVLYHGTVSIQNSKEKICVLSINGQQQIMKVGQEVNEVKLVKANNTEVLVSYKGKRKAIQKI
jgi:hypothetical protein